MSPPWATTSSRFCVVWADARPGAASPDTAPVAAAPAPSAAIRARNSRRIRGSAAEPWSIGAGPSEWVSRSITDLLAFDESVGRAPGPGR